MNITTKKTSIKATEILQYVMIAISILSLTLMIISFFLLDNILNEQIFINSAIFWYLIISTLIYIFLYLIIAIYYNKKFNQDKTTFLNHRKSLIIWSIIFFIISPETVLVTLICVCKKDDGEPPQPFYSKKITKQLQNKKPNKYENIDKKQLRMLKSQLRHGYISQELFDKKIKQLSKQNSNNEK